MRWLDLIAYGVTLRVGAAPDRNPVLFVGRGGDPIGGILSRAGFARMPTGFWVQPFAVRTCAAILGKLERTLEASRPCEVDERGIVVPIPPEMYADDPHDLCLEVDWMATTGAEEAAALIGFGLPNDGSYFVAKLGRDEDRFRIDGLRGRLITLAGADERAVRLFGTAPANDLFGGSGFLIVGTADFAPGPTFIAVEAEEAAA